MKDRGGDLKAYRLTDHVKTYINDIPENEPVTIHYDKENGQLFLSSIIVD